MKKLLLAAVIFANLNLARAQTSDVVILSLTCTPTSAGDEVEGQIKNLTSAPLADVVITTTFQTANGSFVSTSDSPAKFNPLLPGQVSPFDGYGEYNPDIGSVIIQPSILFGASLQSSGPSQVACKSAEN
jgi:hypothetical protein